MTAEDLSLRGHDSGSLTDREAQLKILSASALARSRRDSRRLRQTYSENAGKHGHPILSRPWSVQTCPWTARAARSPASSRKPESFLLPTEFARTAHVSSIEEYQALWNRAKQDPDGFWAEQATELLAWSKPWDCVLDWKPPFAKWFVGGELNASYNCIDRHCEGPNKNKAAIIWEGEPGERRVLRYQDLLREVCKLANILKSLGVKKGDVVAIYLPMIPELIIAALACSRSAPAHGGLRRLQRRGSGRADAGLQGQGPDHRGRRVSPGQRRAPERER